MLNTVYNPQRDTFCLKRMSPSTDKRSKLTEYRQRPARFRCVGCRPQGFEHQPRRSAADNLDPPGCCPPPRGTHAHTRAGNGMVWATVCALAPEYKIYSHQKRWKECWQNMSFKKKKFSTTTYLPSGAATHNSVNSISFMLIIAWGSLILSSTKREVYSTLQDYFIISLE